MSTLSHSQTSDIFEESPFKMSFFKAMMWCFVLGDLLVFAGFLISLGFQRFVEISWPNPHEIFYSIPFFDVHAPLLFASFMTVLLMVSSLTMLFSSVYSKIQNKAKTGQFLLLTILLGLIFVVCQIWEWNHLYEEGAWWGRNPFLNKDGTISPTVFTDYFFIITGFHGVHVVLGLILNIIAYIKLYSGSFEKNGSWGYIENVGIFWHFVDFVWVFVFTVIYLL